MSSTLHIPKSYEGEEFDERTIVLRNGLPSPSEILALNPEHSGYLIWADTHFTHSVGHRATTYIQEEMLCEMQKTRMATSQFLGLSPSKVGPTYSSQSRNLLRWFGLVWPPRNRRERVIGDLAAILTPWHYQRCRPGRTSYSVLADLKSAYMQIAERVPSPLVEILPSGYGRFHALPASHTKKWEDLKALLREHKGLYTRFIGCCTAGIAQTGVKWFHKGVLVKCPVSGIPNLAPFGALVIRVTGEVCQMQAKAAASRYANIDSVTSQWGKDMYPVPEQMGKGIFHEWDRLGLDYTIKAYGPGHFLARGAYQIGTEGQPGFHRSGTYCDWLAQKRPDGAQRMEVFPASSDPGECEYSHTEFHKLIF